MWVRLCFVVITLFMMFINRRQIIKSEKEAAKLKIK